MSDLYVVSLIATMDKLLFVFVWAIEATQRSSMDVLVVTPVAPIVCASDDVFVIVIGEELSVIAIVICDSSDYVYICMYVYQKVSVINSKVKRY